MVTVDLDTRVEEAEETLRPQITSTFLCTLGARRWHCMLHSSPNGCSISVGCKWLVALSQQSALGGKHPGLTSRAALER